ncbi:hypothetical protein VCB98_07015 [Gammaproteobacteria bacterium AB-CW1]|uniref:Uncharacterized protein n=1 Tax=Natronospira elongata TaxID=3110268 RepID=A0AAP6JEN1_9GAMM|nr:hypothetical protein [Gammaproteobacteria bacterium AB-CW1]
MIEFEEAVSTPENWLRQAWQLLEAAKALYQSMDGMRLPKTEAETYREVGSMKGIMLLLGLAVENALKGALVYKFPPDTSGGRLRSSHFQGNGRQHDLVAIAQRMKFPISDEYRPLLERLSIFVQWASKYQVPLRKSEQKKASGNLYLRPPTDIKLVEALITDLQSYAGFDNDDGWPIPR